MRNIRICHITSAHNSNDIRIFQKECRSLAGVDDFDVFLVAKGDSRIEKGVQVKGVGNSGGRLKRMLFFARKVYKAAISINADIYHFHDPELLPYAKKLKKKGKIVFFDSHENTYEQIMIREYIPTTLRRTIGKLYYKYETSVCKKIDGVIFPCPVNGKHPFDGRATRCIYINNYPIIQSSIAEKKWKWDIKICYVGSLSEPRGVTTLLEAYKRINKRTDLILAGKFETEEYKQTLLEEGLLEKVDYRGVCNSEEVKQIYEEASVGLSTLHNVGQYPKLGTFPTKVYEYMANGLAVIVSEYPYSQKMMAEEKIGKCVDPANINSIASAIEYMLENRDMAQRMGEIGKRLSIEKYNWDNEFFKLKELYDEVISKDYNR